MTEEDRQNTNARLTMLEFFIEVMLAQLHSNWPVEMSDKVLSDMQRLMKLAYVMDVVSDSEATEMLRTGQIAQLMASKLCVKIAQRAELIRKAGAEIRA